MIGDYARIVQYKMYYAIDAMNAMTAKQDLLVQDAVNVAIHAAHTFVMTARYWGIIKLKFIAKVGIQ